MLSGSWFAWMSTLLEGLMFAEGTHSKIVYVPGK
jgi:hypothetical protein